MPVPQERSFFGSLNTIRELIESTCADKWDLLITTALPAAGDALWILLIPDPGEILENYLNPRGRRGDKKRAQSGHGSRRLTRFGQLRWWQKISFPDIDQIIADALPGVDAVRGRQVGTAQQWFWRGIDVVDRGLWYWLLIDVGKTFVISWGSGIVESRFCTTPLNALLSISRTGETDLIRQPLWIGTQGIVVASNFGWDLLGNGLIERQNTSIGVSGQFVVVYEGTLDPDAFPSPTEYWLRVGFNQSAGPGGMIAGPKQFLEPGSTFTLAFQADLEDVTAIRVNIEKEPTSPSIEVTEASFGLTCFMTPDT